MGREIRKVAANWEHPKNGRNQHIGLFGDKFSKELSRWEENNKQWENGLVDDWEGGWRPKEGEELNITFSEWDGDKPLKENYMPEWNEDELTHIQLYETTSEGTPVSPVFPANEFEQLCEYAAKNCSTFASFKATKEQWMNMLKDNLVHHTDGNITFI